MKKSTIFIAIIVSLFLQYCGDDGGSSEKVQSEPSVIYYGAKVVATANELPICNSETQGQMYYIQDAQEFQYCDNGSYAIIDITGPQGDQGIQGETGLDSAILVSEETPGTNCTYGGTKIEVGTDDDNDGILDPEEVEPTLTAYICTAYSDLTVWYGDVYIHSIDDITEVSGYDVISGDLTIYGSDVTNIDGLSSVNIITGSLNIINNQNLDNIDGLSNLVRAREISVQDNTALTTINFDSLTSITGSNINISNNYMVDVIQLFMLTGDINLTIDGNSQVTDISLDNVDVPSNITIRDNALLMNVSLPKMISVGALTIGGNAQISSIECDILVNANMISIYSNGSLSNILMPVLYTVSTSLVIGQDASIVGSTGNAILSTITLNALEYIGFLSITDNDTLMNITMNILEVVGWYFSIDNNDILNTLSIGNLCEVSTGADNDAYKQFNVHDNVELCQSDVDALKAQVVGCGGLNWLIEDISNNKSCP